MKLAGLFWTGIRSCLPGIRRIPIGRESLPKNDKSITKMSRGIPHNKPLSTPVGGSSCYAAPRSETCFETCYGDETSGRVAWCQRHRRSGMSTKPRMDGANNESGSVSYHSRRTLFHSSGVPSSPRPQITVKCESWHKAYQLTKRKALVKNTSC